jgi:hypothetical protein
MTAIFASYEQATLPGKHCTFPWSGVHAAMATEFPHRTMVVLSNGGTLMLAVAYDQFVLDWRRALGISGPR